MSLSVSVQVSISDPQSDGVFKEDAWEANEEKATNYVEKGKFQFADAAIEVQW